MYRYCETEELDGKYFLTAELEVKEDMVDQEQAFSFKFDHGGFAGRAVHRNERKGELQTFLPAVFSRGTGKGKLMPGADRVYIQLQAFRITIKGKGEKYVEMQ